MIIQNLADFIVALMWKASNVNYSELVFLPYSEFEASKTRDSRLESVQHYSHYKQIREDLEYFFPSLLHYQVALEMNFLFAQKNDYEGTSSFHNRSGG